MARRSPEAMTRKRRFQLAALVVLAVTVLLVGVVMSAPEPDCLPRRLREVCDPSGDAVSTSRMWVAVGGAVLAFLLFLAGVLEGASTEDQTQTGT
jgi:hypothetical protein